MASLFFSQCRPRRYLSALFCWGQLMCTRSCLTLMDDSSSPFVLNMPSDVPFWLTDERRGQFANADFRSIQCGKTFIKSSVPFFFFLSLLSPCHIICTALSGEHRRADLTLFLRPERADQTTGVKCDWTIKKKKVHFLFCEVSGLREKYSRGPEGKQESGSVN